MRVVKGLIALLLIVSIFGLVGLYSFFEDLGVFTSFFQKLLLQYDWLFIFFKGVLVGLLAILLVVFLVLVFKPLSKRETQIKKEVGQINLPLSTLESIARSSLQGIVRAEDAQVKVRLKDDKAEVEVTISEVKHRQLVVRGKQIQEQITQALPKMAMIETGSIKVIFADKKEDASLLSGNKKESRVI